MSNREYEQILQELLRPVADRYFTQGRGTGPVSRAFSYFALLSLVWAAARFFEDSHYGMLIVLGVLGLTRYGTIAIIGLIIYALIIKYWTGAFILILQEVFGYISYYFGKKNITTLLCSGKPMVEPFENMLDLYLALKFSLVVFGLGIILNGTLSSIMWAMFLAIMLYILVRALIRLYPRYKRVHYPMMSRYYNIAAEIFTDLNRRGKEFDYSAAAQSLLETAVSPTRAAEILKRAEERMKIFSDYDALKKFFTRGGKRDSNLNILELL